MSINCDTIKFSSHAIKKMIARGITDKAIISVVQTGEIIEEYLDDIPYPSKLLLGWVDKQPIHAVIAQNVEMAECIVITTYKPDLKFWHDDLKTRRKLNEMRDL